MPNLACWTRTVRLITSILFHRSITYYSMPLAIQPISIFVDLLVQYQLQQLQTSHIASRSIHIALPENEMKPRYFQIWWLMICFPVMKLPMHIFRHTKHNGIPNLPKSNHHVWWLSVANQHSEVPFFSFRWFKIRRTCFFSSGVALVCHGFCRFYPKPLSPIFVV